MHTVRAHLLHFGSKVADIQDVSESIPLDGVVVCIGLERGNFGVGSGCTYIHYAICLDFGLKRGISFVEVVLHSLLQNAFLIKIHYYLTVLL